MSTTTRFACPSVSLGLSALLTRTRGVLWVCLGLGVAIHLSFTAIRSLEAEQKVAKPLTTQFVKRAPRLTKPLELKKRPQPKRREVRREMVAVKARAGVEHTGDPFVASEAVGGLSRARVSVGRGGVVLSEALEPQSVAQMVEVSKEVEHGIDVSLELLDIQALDTGRYRALVVQNPEDRRDIRGFCRLGVIYSHEFFIPGSPEVHSNFEWQVGVGFRKLVAFMNQATDIETGILGRMGLDDKALIGAPWVLFHPTKSFRLSQAQRCGLGDYLLGGGFMFGDGVSFYGPGPWPEFPSLRTALVESLRERGVVSSIEKLPGSHPVFHCYFDFSGPPGGCDALHHHEHPDLVRSIDYVEGIELEGRLLALISGKQYSYGWALMGPGGLGEWREWDPTPSLRFGANTIILALTQEGSITHRLMETIQ